MLKTHPISFFSKQKIQAREQQKHVLDVVHAEWDKYDYFVMNLPTGVGKTFVACAVSDAVGRAYLLTSTLQLQNQYEKSWDRIVNLKGRGNYQCNVNPNFQVDSAPCLASPKLLKQCMSQSTCEYYTQKAKALRSPAMITNPVYFLYSTHCGFGKAPEDNPWVPRDIIVMDEAHNMEAALISFAQSTVDPAKLHSEHGVKCQHITFNGGLQHDYQALQMILSAAELRAEEYAEKLKEEFPENQQGELFNASEWAKGFNDKAAERVRKLNSKIYSLDKSIQPLKIFFNTHSDMNELKRRWLMTRDADANTLQLAPLYGDFLFDIYIKKMAKKFVFLSATLGTKEQFCRELGIPEKRCLYIETDTPFPPERSPILIMPQLKMGYKDLQETLPKIGPIIEGILDEHKGQRGIIHSATYKLAEELYNRVQAPYRKRFIMRDMEVLAEQHGGTGNRYPKRYNNEDLLRLHEQGTIPGSVLVSPSMMEGVDLYDDLSEFQVILKMPWASLADARIKRKSELDPDWYTNKVWVHIMQASGRSTRHEEDESITYILDKSFPFFYDKWKHRLPGWFKKRLVFAKAK